MFVLNGSSMQSVYLLGWDCNMVNSSVHDFQLKWCDGLVMTESSPKSSVNKGAPITLATPPETRTTKLK